MKPNPNVSCICVTYNRYDQLRTAIDAFLKQTYAPKELVIVDDSTDAMPIEVNQLLAANKRSIKYVRLAKRRTIGYKRNKAISSSTGDVVSIWDDDDIHFPSRLDVQVRTLVQQHRPCDITLVGHRALYHLPSTPSKHLPNVCRRIPKHVHDAWWYKGYLCPSMTFRKRLWTELGGYRHVNKHEDYHFLRKAEQANAVIHVSTKSHFFAYTVHPGGVSSMHAYLRKTI